MLSYQLPFYHDYGTPSLRDSIIFFFVAKHIFETGETRIKVTVPCFNKIIVTSIVTVSLSTEVRRIGSSVAQRMFKKCLFIDFKMVSRESVYVNSRPVTDSIYRNVLQSHSRRLETHIPSFIRKAGGRNVLRC